MYISETSANSSNASLSGLIDARMIDPNSGALTPIPGSPFPINHPQAGDMGLSPGGAFAYLLAEDFPGGNCCVGPWSILVYALDSATGTPMLKQTLAINSSQPAGILVHPSGKFVYVGSNNETTNSGAAGIEMFAVQGDGTLAFIGFTPAQINGGTIALDPAGTFLYTTSFGVPIGNWENTSPCGPINQNVWTFSIDGTTGGLTLAAGTPVTLQRDICIAGHATQTVIQQIDPSGQRLFILDIGNRVITLFAIDAATGALTLLPGTTPISTGASSLAMDPKRRFLYIGSIGFSFTGFSLANPASGTLPMPPGMPVQVVLHTTFDEGSTTLAVDPSGTFLFSNENNFTSAFSCCGPDDFLEFRIDPATGALTQLSSTPFTLAGTASRIVIAPPH